MVLYALPLNANGKIDRKALPEPVFDAGDAYEAPEGELETQLAQLWADVLGVERVGRGSNFFELGGHSLLALTLVERMRAAGIRAQVRELFEQPVLSAFADALAQAQAAALEAEDFSPEVVRIHDRTAFVWARDGVKAMRVSHTALEKRFRVTATARNWNTLEKIAAKF